MSDRMDYEQCVGIVAAAEAYDTQPRFAEVNIVDLGGSVSIREYSTDEAAKTIAFIDSVDTALKPQEKPAAGAKAAARESGSIVKKVMDAEAAGAKAVRKETDRVAMELNSILAAAGAGFKISTAGKADKKLVLLTLSMPDQIGELEKMSTGLASGAYSPEELAIIKTEVAGLARNKGKPKNDFEGSLAAIRDSRLKDVMDKLGM